MSISFLFGAVDVVVGYLSLLPESHGPSRVRLEPVRRSDVELIFASEMSLHLMIPCGGKHQCISSVEIEHGDSGMTKQRVPLQIWVRSVHEREIRDDVVTNPCGEVSWAVPFHLEFSTQSRVDCPPQQQRRVDEGDFLGARELHQHRVGRVEVEA